MATAKGRGRVNDVGQQWGETLLGFGGILNPDRFLAILTLRLLKRVGNHFKGFIPCDNFEFTRAAFAYALHGRLQASLAVDVLNFRNTLQADVLETIIVVGSRLNERQSTVAHGALQDAIAQAMLVVVGAGNTFAVLFVGNGRLEPRTGGSYAHSACEPQCASSLK